MCTYIEYLNQFLFLCVYTSIYYQKYLPLTKNNFLYLEINARPHKSLYNPPTRRRIFSPFISQESCVIKDTLQDTYGPLRKLTPLSCSEPPRHGGPRGKLFFLSGSVQQTLWIESRTSRKLRIVWRASLELKAFWGTLFFYVLRIVNMRVKYSFIGDAALWKKFLNWNSF